MMKSLVISVVMLIIGVGIIGVTNTGHARAETTNNPTDCGTNNFLGFPYWYKYIDQSREFDPVSNTYVCKLKLNGIKDVWLVAAAVIELLIRVASMIAVGMIIYGGVSYIISQGASDKSKQAQSTVINGVIGLVITVIAAAVVSFVAGRF